MNILILYHSRLGATQKMARLIARGVESLPNANAIVRTVPELSVSGSDTPPQRAETGDAFASLEDMQSCDGLIVGSPTRFGNMSAPLKHFIDNTSSLWMAGVLEGKPAAVFTSTSSMHGGQEATLLSMMIPLLHHGMLISGLPYSESSLHKTETGGTPYGASHVAGSSNNKPISSDEKTLCIALGKRIALLAAKLGS